MGRWRPPTGPDLLLPGEPWWAVPAIIGGCCAAGALAAFLTNW
jgi:hypothetical protein